MSLQNFAEKYCDRLYDSRIEEAYQSSGWHALKRMVERKTKPDELNMQIFHPNLRVLLIENWSKIENLSIN